MARKKEDDQESNVPLPRSPQPPPPQKLKTYTAVAQAKEGPDQWLTTAIQSGRSMEEIKMLIELRNEELLRIAKLEFKAAKTVFLKKCPPITKNSIAEFPHKNNPQNKTKYQYTDLDHLINTIKDAEAEAGLSHDWKTGREGANIVVTCILSHAGGHQESDTMSWPADNSGGKQDIQAMASTVSYLRRYTLQGVLGLSQGGDTDGNTPQANGLPPVNDQDFRNITKAVMEGRLTVQQANDTYNLTAGQLNSLERIEQNKPKE